MRNEDTLTKALQRIDERAAHYHFLDRYYAGEQPLAFLSPEAREALGNRMAHLSVNIPRMLVESVAERLRVVGFDGPDAWPTWIGTDLDQESHVAHREALILGRSFILCWARPDGTPNASVESARQVAVLRDPGTREVTAAVKRWETETTTEATFFEPDQVTRLSAPQTGATVHGFETVETFANPLNAVPVVELANRSRLLGPPRSEMIDVLSLTDAVTKLMVDLMVGSEYGSRPRRWATGLELEEDEQGNAINPVGETDRMMVNEAPEGKFGQLPASDLAAYDNAVGVIMRQISAVSGLPEHMLGIGGDNPTSAESIRASEAALTAKAEARQATFGRAWEQVVRLLIAIRDGIDPAGVDVRVRWADPSTRSTAQEADATVKLHQAGILPTSYALRKLGYDADEIAEITETARSDAVSTALAGVFG